MQKSQVADDYCVSPKFLFHTFFIHLKIEEQPENDRDYPSGSSVQHRNQCSMVLSSSLVK